MICHLELLQQSGVQRTERLAPVGIMGNPMKGRPKPLVHQGYMVPRGLSGSLLLRLHIVPSDMSLSGRPMLEIAVQR